MKFRTQSPEELNVDITPLIDIVFLLLIFFMVSTTFQRETELKVELPQAASAIKPEDFEVVEIIINQNGQYFIDGQGLINNQVDTLRNALAQKSSGRKDMPLVIRADARTPHQAVVTAMDVARQLGLLRLSIATSESESAQ